MFRLPFPAAPVRLALAFSLALGTVHAATPAAGSGDGAVELSFIKGDTRDGSKVRLRILGDSIYYHRTLYTPDAPPRTTEEAALLGIQRERTLKILMGELPRYPAFGSCYGKGMRYYLVDTDKGKFYRSLPERAGKCYQDEPGIFGLFEDLDDLLTPPSTAPEDLTAS